MQNSQKRQWLRHKYGPRVHIRNSPTARLRLGVMGYPETGSHRVNQLVEMCYRDLSTVVVDRELPVNTQSFTTRMIKYTPLGVWRGEVLDSDGCRVVVFNVVRAGERPSIKVNDYIAEHLGLGKVRRDFVFSERVEGDDGSPNGKAVIHGKIGGDLDRVVLIFSDIMGASGVSLATICKKLADKVPGIPAKVIFMTLIATPEFFRRFLVEKDYPAQWPLPIFYTDRLDRGLSPEDVLKKLPGEDWDRERGLTDNKYIVPGAGGMGEVGANESEQTFYF